jgi:osmotically-inducible protein OsmY
MDPTMATACPFFDQVQGALESNPYLSTRQFRVIASDGLVRLEGTVRSYYQKQMAQELLRRVDGVERIENQLQVNWR